MKNLLRKVAKKAIRLLRKRALLDTKSGRISSVGYFIGGGIGDGIMAYPAVRFIRRSLPDARIVIFVPLEKLDLLSSIFAGYTVMPLDSGRLSALIFRSQQYTFDVTLGNTIAAFKVRCELAASRSGSISYGFRYPSDQASDRIYSHSRPIADDMHDIDQNLSLAALAIGREPTPEDRLLGTETARRPTNQAPSVVVHPGAEKNYDYKRWPVEKYRIIIRKLADRGCPVTILAGPSETGIGNAFAGMPVNVLIEPDAATLISAFKNADLFLGNDSGPAHMAAFLGVPGITLIGPVNPVRSAPRGMHSVTVSSKEACSPCHFTQVKCIHHRCMQNITPEQVWQEVEKILFTEAKK